MADDKVQMMKIKGSSTELGLAGALTPVNGSHRREDSMGGRPTQGVAGATGIGPVVGAGKVVESSTAATSTPQPKASSGKDGQSK
jgi:hypothetical protein